MKLIVVLRSGKEFTCDKFCGTAYPSTDPISGIKQLECDLSYIMYSCDESKWIEVSLSKIRYVAPMDNDAVEPASKMMAKRFKFPLCRILIK